MTTQAAPTSHFSDRLAAGAFTRLYWAYDVASGEWTITSNRLLEAGRWADLTGTGEFVVTPIASIPSLTPVLTMTRRSDGGVLTYRGPV